jgi:6-phospho-3-hexuloisomerase
VIAVNSAQETQPQPWQPVQNEISGALALIDPREFYALLNAFEAKKGRWFFSGQGRSGLVAQMAAMRFMHLGFDVHVVGEATAPAVRHGDRLFLVCGSGQTSVSVGFAEIAKTEGAELILLTHKPRSRLAAMADLVLTVPMKATAQFGGSLFEQCSIILLDSIALRLAGDTATEQHSEMWRRHTNLQ